MFYIIINLNLFTIYKIKKKYDTNVHIIMLYFLVTAEIVVESMVRQLCVENNGRRCDTCMPSCKPETAICSLTR